MSTTLPKHVDLDNFRLVANLGQGGMGSVYLARYLGDCLVAVKLVRHDGMSPNAQELAERFDRECRILMQLRHPAIVSAYTHGIVPSSGNRYLVMEYVAGQTLSEIRAANKGPLDPREAASLLLPVADALCYCHDRNVFHRDITPKNILVSEGPAEGASHARLVDFGASWQDDDERLTRGVVFGNIDFQPLERFQRDSQGLSPAQMGVTVDVYGLAAVALFLTGGEGPKGCILTTEQKIGTRPIDGGHPDWTALLRRALHARRVERTQSMALFQEDLRRFLGEPVDSLSPRPFWDDPQSPPATDEVGDEALEARDLDRIANLDTLRPSSTRSFADTPAKIIALMVIATVLAFVAGWAFELIRS